MNFNLNIALTVYKIDLIEIDNYLTIFKKINNKINEEYQDRIDNLISYSIISDNPELEKEENFKKILNEFKKIKNLKYYKAEKNLKRINQVIEKINIINAKFIKMCDPDDLILIDETIKIALEIDNLDPRSYIIHAYRQINVIQKIIFENLENVSFKKFFKPVSFNPNTIYPKYFLKKLKKENWSFNHLQWSDDVLAIKANEYDLIYTYIPNMAPYLNNPGAGVSISKQKHSNLDYYYASCEFIKFLQKSTKNLNNKIITDKPNKFFIKNVYNDLFFYDKNRFNKSFKFFYMLFLIKKINKNYISYSNNKNKKHFFWFKFGLLLSLLFKLKF